MSWALVATLLIAGGVAFALRLPPPLGGPWLWLGLPYAGLGALALLRLRRSERLRGLLRFRPGDPSLGIGLGVLLLLSAWALSGWLVPPDSPLHAWVLRVFLVMGDVSNSAVTAC